RDCEMQAGGRRFSKLGQAAARSTAFITQYQRRRYSAQQSAPAAAVDLVRERGDSVTHLECGNRPRRRSVGPGRIEAPGFDFNLEEELFVEGAEATRDRSNAARRTALLQSLFLLSMGIFRQHQACSQPGRTHARCLDKASPRDFAALAHVLLLSIFQSRRF